MVYSPRPMEEKDRKVDELGAKVDELERIAGTLGDVPDEELADTLAEAVRVLGDINARIEARVEAAGEEAREAGPLLSGIDSRPFHAALGAAGVGAAGEEAREADSLLSGIDFGPFDEALEELERREGGAGEPGP